MPSFYFAYGSNLWPGRLAARIGLFDMVGRASLSGHRLSFAKRGGDGSAKCNAERTDDPADDLTGALYAIKATQIRQLDVFEGLGHGYHKEVVELTREGDGARIEAFVYSASPGHVFRQHDAGEAVALPFCWYKQYVLAGARFHAFTGASINAIEAQASRPDQDASRRAKNNHILTLSLSEAAQLHGTSSAT